MDSEKTKEPTIEERLDSLVSAEGNTLKATKNISKILVGVNETVEVLAAAVQYLRDENKKLTQTVANSTKALAEKDEAIKKLEKLAGK